MVTANLVGRGHLRAAPTRPPLGTRLDWYPTSLLVILAKYGLDGRKDARAVSSNSLGDGMEQDSLEDPRLEKLWHKVPSQPSANPKTCPLASPVGGCRGFRALTSRRVRPGPASTGFCPGCSVGATMSRAKNWDCHTGPSTWRVGEGPAPTQGACCGLQAESGTRVVYLSLCHPPGKVSGVTRGRRVRLGEQGSQLALSPRPRPLGSSPGPSWTSCGGSFSTTGRRSASTTPCWGR